MTKMTKMINTPDINMDELAESADHLASEFKEFIARGNVLDLAIATIMGGAFGGIVSSLVGDVITPMVGLALPSQGLKESYILLKCPLTGPCDFPTLATALEAGAVTLNWGNFCQSIMNFLIISLFIFMMVKCIASATKATAAKKRASVMQMAVAARHCEFCDSEISRKATRCPHCTAMIGPDPAPNKKSN